MRESTLWMWHIFAGVVILVLLGMHMFMMHFDGIFYSLGMGEEEVLSWNSAESTCTRNACFADHQTAPILPR